MSRRPPAAAAKEIPPMNPPESPSAVQLDQTSAEVKQYQRQKLIASIASLVLSFMALTALALWAGPRVDHIIRSWLGDNLWLRLIVLAGVYAAVMELLTLPLDFWSGFVLEHRYQLSNLTFQ